MKLLMILVLLVASVAMSMTLKYDDYDGIHGGDIFWYKSAAVWFDLDSLGGSAWNFDVFEIDSVIVAFGGTLEDWDWDPDFELQIWTGNEEDTAPDSLLWSGAFQASPSEEDYPLMQSFDIPNIEVTGDIWAVVTKATSSEGPYIGKADVGDSYHSFGILNPGDPWTNSGHKYIIRLQGDGILALEPSSWGAIKAQF